MFFLESLSTSVVRVTHLENLVLHDLMAWRESRIEQVELFYWRTSIVEEVDFVVESGDSLLPEVKATLPRHGSPEDVQGRVW